MAAPVPSRLRQHNPAHVGADPLGCLPTTRRPREPIECLRHALWLGNDIQPTRRGAAPTTRRPNALPERQHNGLDAPARQGVRTTCRSDSASAEPLATGQPYGAVPKTSPAASSAPPLSLIANPVTGESADIVSSCPATNAAVRSS